MHLLVGHVYMLYTSDSLCSIEITKCNSINYSICYMMSLGCTLHCIHNTVCYGVLRAEGKKPYLIPIGGSSVTGLWGQIEVFRELLEQVTDV